MSTSKKSPSPSPAVQPAAKPAPLAPPAVLGAAASHAGLALKPPAYDPTAAAAFLKTFRPQLDAIADADLLIPRLDVRAAALAALGVYAFITQDDALHERFKKQGSIGEFDLANIEALKAAAFLVFSAHAQAEAAGAFATDAKVPADVVEEGLKTEGRMQELCEYKFKRDPKVAPLLAILRPGKSYRDLAGDLLGYADIYEMNPAAVAEDTTNYHPSDVTDARRIAGEILAQLAANMTPKAREAYTLLQRSWTFLVQVYFEVQEVGACLLRCDPRRADWLPSLYAAGRSGRPKKKKAATVAETPKVSEPSKTSAE